MPPPPIPPRPLPPPTNVPTVDFAVDSQFTAQQTITNAALTTGFAYLRNLPMEIDFAAARRIFDEAYSSPAFANRFQWGGNVPSAFTRYGKWAGDESEDDKATITFPSHSFRGGPWAQATINKFGPDFPGIAAFYLAVEDQLVPLVIQATSDAISYRTGVNDVDMWFVRREGKLYFTLIDYHRSPAVRRLQGMQEHRDDTIATIIFQDGIGGLEIQDQRTGQWFSVPGNEVIVMWGRAGEAFSGGIVRAVNHRVTTIATTRRMSAIAFIGADDSAQWKPLVETRRVN
jgi:2OG-Fe(II) oxygenase superfamily